MRLDHLSYAAGPDGLASTAQRIGGLLGREFIDGGVHPRFGTRNMIMPLADGTYLEIVEVLDHPASDKAPFGQAVRARSALGGGWLGLGRRGRRHHPGREPARPRGGRGQPAPARRHRAALEADRRQRPDRRPAAAVLHPVGQPARTCTPATAPTRRTPWPAWRSPATRSGSASGSARPSRRRSRTSRSSGSPRTAPRASSPRRCRPRTAWSESERAAAREERAGRGSSRDEPPARGGAEPEHLAPHRDVRDRRTGPSTLTGCSRPPWPRCWAARAGPDGGCSTSAAAPGSTCRASPRPPRR